MAPPEPELAAAQVAEILVTIKDEGPIGLNFWAEALGDRPILGPIEQGSVVAAYAPLVEEGMLLKYVGGQLCGAAADGGLAFAQALELIKTRPRPIDLVFASAGALVAVEPGLIGLTLQRQPSFLVGGATVDVPVIDAIDADSVGARARPALRPGMRLLSIQLVGDKLGRPVRLFDQPYDDTLTLLQMAKRPVTLQFAAAPPAATESASAFDIDGPAPVGRRLGGWWRRTEETLRQKAEEVVAASDRAAESLGQAAGRAWRAEQGATRAGSKEEGGQGGDDPDGGLERMSSWSRDKLEAVDAVFKDAGPMGITFIAEQGAVVVAVNGIKEDSPASAIDGLCEGSELAGINGQGVEGLPFDAVISMLRNATRPTTLQLLTVRPSAFDAFAQFT